MSPLLPALSNYYETIIRVVGGHTPAGRLLADASLLEQVEKEHRQSAMYARADDASKKRQDTLMAVFEIQFCIKRFKAPMPCRMCEI